MPYRRRSWYCAQKPTKMPLGDDKLIGLVSTTRDITARKHAESCMRKNAQLEEDLAAARQLRPTGRLRRRNTFPRRLYGLAPDPPLANSH
jgi:hypothetical protein